MPPSCSMQRTCSRTRPFCFRPICWSQDVRSIAPPAVRYVTTAAWPAANPEFARHLEDMKSRHLPVEEGLWESFNLRALRKSLQSHLSLPPLLYRDPVPPGYHQVSFNTVTAENELSHDGAEQRHAPSDKWKFRVWAGGRMEFQRPHLWSDGSSGPLSVAVRERIADTRLVGNLEDEDAKVMVTLSKTLFQPEMSAEREPVRHESGDIRILDSNSSILLREEKILCFMRSIPPSLTSASSTRKIGFPSDSIYSQTMVPSPTLLFRFSALTRNAHAIHLDAEYTRRVYGLRKPLVQGPLTSVLMLDVLGEALSLQTVGKRYSLAIRTFQYRNLLPLFVNEPITIACKKTHDIEPEGARYKTNFEVPWQKWTFGY